MTSLVVAGARPQFVKAAALMPALDDALLVHTGQHTDPAMVELGLRAPDVELEIAATGRVARLAYETVATCKRGARLRVTLGTGFAHQIRAQLSHD